MKSPTVGLAPGLALPVEIERHLVEAVALHDVPRQVVGGIGDDRDAGHGAGAYPPVASGRMARWGEVSERVGG
jgi:hypothetical protein